MPTNLPPEYFSADKKYREARTPDEKITFLEELISTIPKHKGTDKLRAEYRKKLSKLKSSAQSHKKTGKYDSHFHIEKEGARRVIILGCSNVGKSTLVAALTHATPEISESPFTTWAPTPGMMTFEDIQIQLIDTPPLDREYTEPELVNLIHSSDLILLVVDLQAYPVKQFLDGVEILHQMHVKPHHERNDNSKNNIRYIPILVVINKFDDNKYEDDFKAFQELLEDEWKLLPISVSMNHNLNQLMKSIITELKIIKIYSKPPGKEADLTKPFVLKEGGTVEEFAAKVHHDFLIKLKSARIWGTDVYDGQAVGRDHILHDGDIVELHI